MTIAASKPVLAALSCLAAISIMGASCSGQPASGPDDRETLDGVRATVVQQRIDEGTRRIAIQVGTGPDTSLHVRGVQLRSWAFQPVPPTAKDTVFAGGQTIDLTTRYGEPRCSDDDPPGGSLAILAVQGPDGPRTIEVPVSGSGVELIRRLHGSECSAAALQDAAPVSYAEPFARARSGGEQALVGALELRRPATGGSGAPVVVNSLSGSVLFDLEPLEQPGSGLVTRLAPSDDQLALPVRIAPRGRCDQHARSQSTQTFLFSVFVRVGSAAEHREILVPSPALQRQALALLDDVCPT